MTTDAGDRGTSRRSFLAGTALAGAGVLAAGCSDTDDGADGRGPADTTAAAQPLRRCRRRAVPRRPPGRRDRRRERRRSGCRARRPRRRSRGAHRPDQGRQHRDRAGHERRAPTSGAPAASRRSTPASSVPFRDRPARRSSSDSGRRCSTTASGSPTSVRTSSSRCPASSTTTWSTTPAATATCRSSCRPTPRMPPTTHCARCCGGHAET